MTYPRGAYGPGQVSDVKVEKPAVIILDMAKGYGWAPGSHGYEMVAKVRRLMDAAHAADVQVVHVTSLRRPTDNLPAPTVSTLNNMAGLEGPEVIPELAPEGDDIHTYKRYLSAFFQSDLDYTLRCMGVDCVIFAGASTDNTVLWSSADAFQFRYKVVVAEDCTMVHRNQPGAAAAQAAALGIIATVLKGEVIPLDKVIEKYLQPH
jgi:nicotinamidase-related amidase